MEEQLMKKVFVISTILSLTALVVMAVYLYGRENADFLKSLVTQEVRAESRQDNEKTYVGIPLPSGTTEEDVAIRDDYMQQTIIADISNAPAGFYDDRDLSGSSMHIQAVYYDTVSHVTSIYIVLDELCEYSICYYADELQLSLIPVHDMYDKVMIVDVGHGGEATGSVSYGICEKDVALGIATKLKQMLDQTDIRVYYTRLTDQNVEDAERIAITQASGADFFVSIHTNADADSHVTTGIMTYGDETKAESGMTGTELALAIQNGVIQETGAKDNGMLEDTGSVRLLQELAVPSAMLEAGYVTNRQEALQLASASYQEKIAKGIYKGITEAYESIGKSVNQVKENE